MGTERLGRYTVLKHLASGGMADVLLARSDGIEGFERHVVLKRIRSEHAKDERFIQMFLDEARVAANLHHANIVQVNDIGENRGELFFAMEYLHGEDLRKILSVHSKNKTHMPLAHVIAIVSAAAAGLHYAHERKGSDKKPLNIVHRDVSPSNIIIGYDGSVKVVDFGIAKAAMRQLETRSGSLKGKVSYMSPEQCKGDPIDRRSDVYALGVLLYELSTTTRLFKGENDYLMMDAIVNGKIPLPRVRRPDLPNELSSIIMRCLSVEPSRRYQSADELRVALDQFAANAGMTTSQSTLATYMRKLFGEKPEPWLDGSTPSKLSLAQEDAARNSWSDLGPDEAPSSPPDPDKTRSDRKVSQQLARVGKGTGPATPIPPRETRTSMQMGWEQTPGDEMPAPAPAPSRKKPWLALIAMPAVALVGIGVWQFGLKNRGAHETTTTASVQPTPPPAPPTISPIETAPTPPPPAPVAPAQTSATPAPAPVAVAVAAPTPAPAPVSHAKSSSRKTSSKVAAAMPAPTPAPTPVPTPAPIAAPPPPPVTAPVVTPPPAPTPPPPAQVAQPAPPPAPAAEVTVAQLSQATVQMVASDHSSQLGKCDAGEVHGDISVTFQIDANGKVVKSQLSTSVKNPKLAACILRAVTSWKFPKPPSGAAKGTYSISYQ